MARSACLPFLPKKRDDPDPFFPERGATILVNDAIVVCFGCPVRRECNAYKERIRPTSGVWACEYIGRS